MTGERREFRASRTRTQHGFLLGAVLALVGLGTLLFAGPSVPDAELVGAVAVALRNARDATARMVLAGEGIWFRDWGIGPVPWAAIDDAYTSGSRLQAFVSLRLRDPDGFLASLPDTERVKLKGNRLYRSPDLRIPHGALDAPLDQVLAAIKTHLGGSSG
jgi:xanthine/CO dehydrogenase XdhC/CoxF family maturation factor